MSTAATLTRPATWPLPKKGKTDIFGFSGTTRQCLERQYYFYLKAYALPVATRTDIVNDDGELVPTYTFDYPADAADFDMHPGTPARVREHLAYIVTALTQAPAIADTSGQMLLL